MRISDWSSDVCSSDLRQDVPYRRQFISPGFDLHRPKWILRPRNLDAGLNLSQGDRRKVKVGILLGFQPGKHGAVGTSTTKLRDDVGVEKEHLQCFGNAALTGTPGRNRKVAAFTIRKEQLIKRGEIGRAH